jgi:hypothetical protein
MSRCCWMFKECLVCCSMCLGLTFISPRQLGAVWVPFGRLWLPSVRGRTGQSGAPPDSEQCAIFFLFWRSRPLQPPAPVAHRIVRCDLLIGAICHPLITQSTVNWARGWHTGQSGAHQTVRWIIAMAPWVFSKSGQFAWARQPGHRTLSGVPQAGASLARLSQTSSIRFLSLWEGF